MNWRQTGRVALRAAQIMALLSLSIFLLEAAALMRTARTGSQELTASTLALESKATATLTDARRVILSIGGTAAEVRKTSITTRQAALEQRRLLREATAEAVKTLQDTDAGAAALTAFIDGTNTRVNSELLPRATEAVKTLNSAGRRLTENLEGLRVIEANLALATGGMADLANNPDIPRSIANVQASTADIKTGLDMVVVKERQLMKPGNFAWHVLTTLLSPAAHGAQIYSAVH